MARGHLSFLMYKILLQRADSAVFAFVTTSTTTADVLSQELNPLCLFAHPADPLLWSLRAQDQLLHQLPECLSRPCTGLPDIFPSVPHAFPGCYQPRAAVHVRHRAHKDLWSRLKLHLRE